MIEPEIAAAALIQARLDYSVLETFPGGAFPADLAEGYAVLDSIVAQFGIAVGGWKVALTNDVAMKRMNTDRPAAGPIFQPYIMASPKLLNLPSESSLGLECEFAFRMGGTLPSRQEPFTSEEVLGMAESLHPAIEVVDSRIAGRADHGAPAVIADHCGNAAFVHGEGTTDWRGLDLATQKVTLTVNGEHTASGSGGEVLGDPRNSLVWLANFLSVQGKGLKAGDWVTTGSTMGICPAPPGSVSVADFGSLGRVEVSFTD